MCAMSFFAIALQSGSSGNCIYVQAGSTRLLFDAGISAKKIQNRLQPFGIALHQVDAVMLSHEHSDHVSSARVLARRHHLPMFASRGTAAMLRERGVLGAGAALHAFCAGETLRFGTVSVETLPTPHDGVDGVAFIVDAGSQRLGILTDLGHVFDGLREAVRSLDGAFLESNYDPAMLENGPYPASLRARVAGPGGHLSNGEAAELLRSCAGARMKWATLAHLSENNNSEAIARETHRALGRPGLPVHVASRNAATGIFQL